MDKTLLKAYIRTIVEEEVKRVLPDILGEAIAEIKNIQRVDEVSEVSSRPKLDRSKLAAMMGLERIGDTLSATTNKMLIPDGANVNVNDPQVKPAVDAINRDYSLLMKKMGLSK